MNAVLYNKTQFILSTTTPLLLLPRTRRQRSLGLRLSVRTNFCPCLHNCFNYSHLYFYHFHSSQREALAGFLLLFFLFLLFCLFFSFFLLIFSFLILSLFLFCFFFSLSISCFPPLILISSSSISSPISFFSPFFFLRIFSILKM